MEFLRELSEWSNILWNGNLRGEASILYSTSFMVASFLVFTSTMELLGFKVPTWWQQGLGDRVSYY